jgi:hypothetical protein
MKRKLMSAPTKWTNPDEQAMSEAIARSLAELELQQQQQAAASSTTPETSQQASEETNEPSSSNIVTEPLTPAEPMEEEQGSEQGGEQERCNDDEILDAEDNLAEVAAHEEAYEMAQNAKLRKWKAKQMEKMMLQLSREREGMLAELKYEDNLRQIRQGGPYELSDERRLAAAKSSLQRIGASCDTNTSGIINLQEQLSKLQEAVRLQREQMASLRDTIGQETEGHQEARQLLPKLERVVNEPAASLDKVLVNEVAMGLERLLLSGHVRSLRAVQPQRGQAPSSSRGSFAQAAGSASVPPSQPAFLPAIQPAPGQKPRDYQIVGNVKYDRCYSCGVYFPTGSGHVARTCPERVCYNCGEKGHSVAECTNPSTKRPRGPHGGGTSPGGGGGSPGGASCGAVGVV